MLTNLSVVRSSMPKFYSGQFFSYLKVSRVSVREMGGFPIVLRRCITLPVVSGPPPLKPPMQKFSVTKLDTAFPCVTSAPRLPIMSPPRVCYCDTIAATLSLSCPRPATMSSPRHRPVSYHITHLYLGPASDVMLMSSRKSTKSAKMSFFIQKARKRLFLFISIGPFVKLWFALVTVFIPKAQNRPTKLLGPAIQLHSLPLY